MSIWEQVSTEEIQALQQRAERGSGVLALDDALSALQMEMTDQVVDETRTFWAGRDVRIDDDVTGGAALFDKIRRTPREGMLDHALDHQRWMRVYQDLWTRFGGELRLDGTSPAAPTWGTGGMMSGRSVGSTRCGGD